MRRSMLIFLASPFFGFFGSMNAGEGRLLRQPTVGANSIAFVHAGEIWTVERTGWIARRLTSGEGRKALPRFSPDGKWIAYSEQISGNTDVFLIPAAGGVPHRLTYHPDADIVRGWTPDGKSILI